MWKIVLWICVAGWEWGGVRQSRATLMYNMENMTTLVERDYGDSKDLLIVNYTSPRVNYFQAKALSEFDMRAMGPLYNASYSVIDVITFKQAYPAGIVSVSDGHVYVSPLRREWPKLLYHYAGVAAVSVAVALFVLGLPLVGLLWSCCCWCRKRRRRRPFDRKYDNCRKSILTLVFIGLLTLFLFGIVCAFSTESQLETSLAEAPSAVRHGVAGVRQYINATHVLANWLLTNNYDELEEKLVEMLNSLGYRATLRLGTATRLSVVDELSQLVTQLDELRGDLLLVHNLTQSLRTRAEELNAGLRKVKNQLLQTLAKCDQPKCIALQNKYKIGQLDTEIQYSQMPDVTEIVSKVSAVLDTNIKADVAEGQRALTDMQNNIQRSINRSIPGILKSLRETGRYLADVARQVTELANNASEEVSKASVVADRMQSAYDTYGPYRQYVGFGTACALLLIMCVMVWGLMCGVCGKRPDAYGISDCCNKAAGTKSLYCGVVVIFAIGWAIALVFLAYFLVGIAAQRFVCDPLVEPRGNRLFADVEKLVDLEVTVYKKRTPERFNMTTVMVMCHQNKTLYEVLQLHRVIKLDAVKASLRSEMELQLSALRPTLAPPGGRVIILRESTRNKLHALADAGLDDFDFDRIFSALETNMTTLALDALSQQLLSTAASLKQPVFRQEALDLQHAAADLTTLSERVLAPIMRDAATLNETALRLQNSRRWFGVERPATPTSEPPPPMQSVENMIALWVDITEQAERIINDQGGELIEKLMHEYGAVVKEKVNEYLQRVRNAAVDDVGHCGPLSAVFNSTRGAACDRILLPLNGYWMSLGWCILLFIPMMVVAVRLAKLYLHADPYPGPLVEAEYLYDAYADRDNVPLANAYKVEKRTGREARGARGRDGEGRVSSGGGGSGAGPGPARADAALAPPLDSYNARRYNDMAPKHWEEVPPRYHGPTEYERPPPYYYPGPNDRQ